MHWIEQFRKEYRHKDGRTGLSRDGLAKMVRERKVGGRNVGCSENLIFILEHGGITAPGIAAAITTVCGGTAEQWDGIVHEDYRGQWKPGWKTRFEPRVKIEAEDAMAVSIVSRGEVKRGKAPKNIGAEKKEAKPPKPQQPRLLEHQQRTVVEIDTAFQEVKRYANPEEVANAMETRLRSITIRCDRQVAHDMDEMQRFGCTWRYADEWDAMTPEQRIEDMTGARKRHAREKRKCI